MLSDSPDGFNFLGYDFLETANQRKTFYDQINSLNLDDNAFVVTKAEPTTLRSRLEDDSQVYRGLVSNFPPAPNTGHDVRAECRAYTNSNSWNAAWKNVANRHFCPLLANPNEDGVDEDMIDDIVGSFMSTISQSLK